MIPKDYMTTSNKIFLISMSGREYSRRILPSSYYIECLHVFTSANEWEPLWRA